MKSNKGSIKDLLVAAASFAGFSGLWLLGGWLLSFAVMNLFDTFLPVGMNYLAYPFLFIPLAMGYTFIIFMLFIPLMKISYDDVIKNKFVWIYIIAPLMVTLLVLMLATCPLDTGGTFLSRGWEAFTH